MRAQAKFGSAVLSFFAAPALFLALDKCALAASVEEVALLKSTNREKVLVEGAKKEGKVNFYTGLIVDQVVRPVKDAFEITDRLLLRDSSKLFGFSRPSHRKLSRNTLRSQYGQLVHIALRSWTFARG